MSESGKSTSDKPLPWVAILTFLGIVIPALLAYLATRTQVLIPIETTQTADAIRIAESQTAASSQSSGALALTATGPPGPTSVTTPNASTTITVTNESCTAQDYYVDDKLITTIAAGATASFQVVPGHHSIRACNQDTNDCGSSTPADWSRNTASIIARAPGCPEATIILTNQNCVDENVFVDDQFMIRAAAEAATSFKVTPGQHSMRACRTDTSICGSGQFDWSQSTIAAIRRDASCPAASVITLISQTCTDQDYYVDHKVVTTVAAGASVNFQVAPGKHLAQSCTAGTKSCGPSAQKDWSQSTATTILRDPSCPLATIALTNEDCNDWDYDVDGQLKTKVAANATITFQVIPGLHWVRTCSVGSESCAPSIQLDWSQSTTAVIPRSSSCH